ncbi:amino acid permease [Orbus wheelerorum]|uniref:amino acid permease n=1 Tax=Orbus wheelerorum TaxID=3074111 RepID=UPI00370DB72E
MSNTNTVKKLSLFGFFAITASMVLTVYEYPAFAVSKMNLVFYLLVAGFLWFIPVSLVSAEMATVKGWQKGGIFTWVEKTLGPKWGFAAVFYQWFQITVCFITMIYFIIGAFSMAFGWSELNSDPWLKLAAVLVIFWVVTISQFWGTKWTEIIAKFGFIFGVFGSGILLFVLAIIYILQGGDIQVSFGADAWIPDFSKFNTLVIFVSFILAYCGVESSASHANEMKNPARDYPLAMLLLVIVAIGIDILGGFTIAATIPQSELGLNTGVIQAFEYLISYFGGAAWIVSAIAIIICIGVIAEIACWVVGPSAALLNAAEKGLLPKSLAKTNKAAVPVNLVIIQGVVVSIWACVLTLGGGGGNLSFFIAIALTVCIYLVAYTLMFIGYLKLTYKQTEKERAFRIPGGKFGKTIIALVGLVITIFAFFISFFPPANIGGNISDLSYFAILVICWAAMVAVPFLIYHFYGKKHYQPEVVSDN